MEFDGALAQRHAKEMGMTICYLYFFHKGPAWTHESTPEIEDLQERHVTNLRRLRREKNLVLNGPFLDSIQLSGEARGVSVLKAQSFEQAREMIDTDPMVKTGRRSFELYAWMVNQ